jgi:RNA polymerase sigma-70 factor (ECF subfamily)
MVIAARGNDTPESHEALAWLCEHYWFPLYTFARSRGADPHSAQDFGAGILRTILSSSFTGIRPCGAGANFALSCW